MQRTWSPSVDGKLFVVGLNRTGTKSLHLACRILGLRSAHYICAEGDLKEIIEANHHAGQRLLTGVNHYDAYSDWIGTASQRLYAVLDVQYPGSRFVLTTRDRENWIRSRHYLVLRSKNLSRLRKQYPNSSWFHIDRNAWRREFETHHDEVTSYFKDRPQDFITMDFAAGEGWEKLCRFLGRRIPNRPFPHAHRRSIRPQQWLTRWLYRPRS